MLFKKLLSVYSTNWLYILFILLVLFKDKVGKYNFYVYLLVFGTNPACICCTSSFYNNILPLALNLGLRIEKCLFFTKGDETNMTMVILSLYLIYLI